MATKSIKFNFIMNLLTTGMSFVFPLITFPYVTRILQPSGYGIAEYALATASTFSLFALLGVNLYGIRECSKVRDDKERLSKISCELLFILAVSTILVSAVYIVLAFAVPSFRNELSCFLIAGLTIPLTTLGVEWFLKAKEQFVFIAIRSFIVRVAMVVLMFALVRDERDVAVWVAVSVLSNGAAGVANFAYLLKHTSRVSLRELEIVRHLKPMLYFFLAAAAITVYTTMDTVMLGMISGEEAVAYYAVAVKIKNIAVAAMAALANVLVPRAAYLIERDPDGYRAILNKSVHCALMFSLFVPLGIMIVADPVVLLLAGEAYGDSVGVLRISLIAVVFIAFSQITANEILTPKGKEKYLTVSYALAAAADFASNLLLIPVLGALGAAISSSLAEGVVLLCQCIAIRKCDGHVGAYLAGTAKILIPAALALATEGILFPVLGGGFGAAFVSACAAGIVYLAALAVAKETVVTDLLSSLPGKIAGSRASK